MPKHINREILTGPREFDEMEKTGDRHQRHDGRRRTSANGPGKCRYARCEDDTEWFGHEQRRVIRRRVCDRLERAQSQQGNKQEGTELVRGVASWTQELRNGRVAEEMTEERMEVRRAPKGSKPHWYGDKDKGGTRSRGKDKGKVKGKSETPTVATIVESKGHMGVNCPFEWTNMDEEDDHGSSWESEAEGEEAEEPHGLEALDDEGESCWPRRNNTR